MSVYKFRVMYEEDENIFRDLEVRPNQSFVEFEDLLITAWALPSDSKGMFFVSNDRMQKLRPIDHRKPVKKGDHQFMPMILAYVEDPHQKFLYEHAGRQELTFYIELLIIAYEKPGTDYPRIVKSSGPSPVKKEDMYKHIGATAVVASETEGIDEDDSQLLKGFGTEGEDVVAGAADEDTLDLGDENDEAGDDSEEKEESEDAGFERFSAEDEERF